MIKPLVLVGVLAVMNQALAAVELPATLAPYLQNPTADGITVCFLAQKGAEQTGVAWSRDGQPAVTNTSAVALPIPGTPWTIWKTRLTKLVPDARYEYQVQYRLADAEAVSLAYHFQALNPEAKAVRFAVFNDIHNRDGTLAALMRSVKPDDYQFSLLLGDMWTNPDAANGAKEVFRTLDAYIHMLNASEKPFVFVRGNHETIGSFADKMAYLFDLPNLDSTKSFFDQNWYFTLRGGPVWFLALDGGDDFIKRYEQFQPCRERQAEWMRGVLAQHADGGAAWRVLLTHMPLYNDNIWNSEPCRLMWEPIVTNANFDFEMGGHDHQWKQLPKGKTFSIEFNGHYPDQQDPQQRKTYSYTTPFPMLIGGGPALKEGDELGAVMLVTADEQAIQVRWLAATDGRVLSEFRTTKAKPAAEGGSGAAH